MQKNWHQKFFNLAKHVSTWSFDRRTKVGAVIVGLDNEVRSVGYNGFPRGVDDSVENRYERPLKIFWTEHAERNAIYNAIRASIPIHGSKIYSTLYPCTDCARAIIQSGIKEVITSEPDWELPNWGEQFKISKIMFEEAGITVTYINN